MEWPLVGRESALASALQLVASGTGLALVGPAGVGKSRLLSELGGEYESGGGSVIRAVASATTRSIPFAPFIELLPGGPTPDRLAMLAAARQELETQVGGRRTLISIDDAHHLDPVSLSFLVSIVGSGSATVAMTARVGEMMEPDLVDLWTDGKIQRTDLGPLARVDARRLVESVLGGATTARLETELWRLSSGNPLVMHEILEGAVGTTIVQDTDGTWDLDGSPARSPRLADLVTSRLRAIPGDLRPAMDVVALGAPIPYATAWAALGERLADLENRRLVMTAGSGGERTIVPAHPLYGEILKAQIGESRVRAACRTLLRAAGTGEDPLRLALWQRDAGETVSVDIAVGGAQAALIRHDPALCEELLAPLDATDDRIALLRGRALSYQQRFEEAETMLADRWPGDPQLLTEIASIRAQNLGFGFGQVPEARDLLEAAARDVDDPDLRARLKNERAMVSAIHGDFSDAMSASDEVLNDPNTSPPSRAAAYVTLTVALAMTGNVTRFDAIHDEALRYAILANEVLPFAWDQIEVMQVVTLINAGKMLEAVELSEAAIERAGRGDALLPTWLAAKTMALLPTGRLGSALTAAQRAYELFAEADPFGLQPQALGLIAYASGQRGDPPPSAALDHIEVSPLTPRLSVWIDLGRAWAAWARGRPLDGAQIAVEGARRGIAGEHYAWAALCLCDAARLGAPGLAIDQLPKIAAAGGAEFLDRIRLYIESLAGGDSDRTLEAAGGFASLGACLLAADAYAQAAAILADRDEPVRAARSVMLSRRAELQCDDPSTPALVHRPRLLTPRELEVAFDAGRGLSSRDIAAKRFISARTVDNHLRYVYRKLAITGRDDLASLLSGALTV
jgi:DNA-binding CsgD family transcriptional regulator/tetratricopeptide (TPR) repeat protein